MRFVKLLPYVLTIIAICAPIIVTYDFWEKGPISIKSLEVSDYGTSNVLSTLNVLEEQFDFSLNYGDDKVNHLYSVTSLITNTGKSPILPSDFFKGINVRVDKKWKILSVHTTTTGIGRVNLEWERVSNYFYQSKPTLINPGDRIYVTAYVTYTNSNEYIKNNSDVKIKLKYSARIANMKGITKRDSNLDTFQIQGPQISINLAGWAIVLFLILYSLFFFLQYWLLIRARIMREERAFDFTVLIGVSLLSIMTAEVISHYIFPHPLLVFFSQDGTLVVLHFSILMIQSLIMSYLFWKGRA